MAHWQARFTVVLSAEELAGLDRAATSRGQAVSEFVRIAALREMTRALPQATWEQRVINANLSAEPGQFSVIADAADA